MGRNFSADPAVKQVLGRESPASPGPVRGLPPLLSSQTTLHFRGVFFLPSELGLSPLYFVYAYLQFLEKKNRINSLSPRKRAGQ